MDETYIHQALRPILELWQVTTAPMDLEDEGLDCRVSPKDSPRGDESPSPVIEIEARPSRNLGDEKDSPRYDEQGNDEEQEVGPNKPPYPIIFEIGPGHGHLTRHLLATPFVKKGVAGARVIALEADRRFEPHLKQLQDQHPGQLAVIFGDATRYTLEQILQGGAKTAVAAGRCINIIANLPYNVATTLLLGWFDELHRIISMTVMIQEEVAQRLIAKPRTKDYGRLAIITQYCCEVHHLFCVPPQAFVPPPKVMSAVVHLRPRLDVDLSLLPTLAYLTRCCFQNRRKTLMNGLKNTMEDDVARTLLATFSIAPTARSEEIDYQTFVSMAQWLRGNYGMDALTGLPRFAGSDE